MSGKVKAIETIYNDYRFRSRLEARWAVFMDELGVEYRYEPEGFELDGIRYLPDFYLPKLKTWFEIKPEVPTNDEREKAFKLCVATKDLVVLLAGEPWIETVGYGYVTTAGLNKDEITEWLIESGLKPNWLTTTECIATFVPASEDICGADIHHGYCWCFAQWVECTQCNLITLDALGAPSCSCKNKTHYYHDTPRLMNAYKTARQARFEFGR